MTGRVVGLIHPGAMGAAVGAVLRANGHRVLWASEGRGETTVERARKANLSEVPTVAELADRSDIVISVVPPHGARGMAAAVAGRAPIVVDANAVSPATASEIADLVERAGGDYVDGGIVGPPPQRSDTTRLYLSGTRASEVAGLFAAGPLEARVLAGEPTAASALKMAYAAWTKGTDALILAILAVARAYGVDRALEQEWRLSQPGLLDRVPGTGWTASTKGWRWLAEMEEIAATFDAVGLPSGFHQAAATVFGRVPRDDTAARDQAAVRRAVEALLEGD